MCGSSVSLSCTLMVAFRQEDSHTSFAGHRASWPQAALALGANAQSAHTQTRWNSSQITRATAVPAADDVSDTLPARNQLGTADSDSAVEAAGSVQGSGWTEEEVEEWIWGEYSNAEWARRAKVRGMAVNGFPMENRSGLIMKFLH